MRSSRSPATAPVPIIMFTARTGEADRVAGSIGRRRLRHEPFHPRELAPRPRGSPPRHSPGRARTSTRQHLVADFDAVSISVDGRRCASRAASSSSAVPGRTAPRPLARPAARARRGTSASETRSSTARGPLRASRAAAQIEQRRTRLSVRGLAIPVPRYPSTNPVRALRFPTDQQRRRRRCPERLILLDDSLVLFGSTSVSRSAPVLRHRSSPDWIRERRPALGTPSGAPLQYGWRFGLCQDRAVTLLTWPPLAPEFVGAVRGWWLAALVVLAIDC